MEKNRKTPKRLILNIDEELHREIKVYSAMRNMSVSQYVREAIGWRIVQEVK